MPLICDCQGVFWGFQLCMSLQRGKYPRQVISPSLSPVRVMQPLFPVTHSVSQQSSPFSGNLLFSSPPILQAETHFPSSFSSSYARFFSSLLSFLDRNRKSGSSKSKSSLSFSPLLQILFLEIEIPKVAPPKVLISLFRGTFWNQHKAIILFTAAAIQPAIWSVAIATTLNCSASVFRGHSALLCTITCYLSPAPHSQKRRIEKTKLLKLHNN